MIQGGVGEHEQDVSRQRHHNVHADTETTFRAEFVGGRSGNRSRRRTQHTVTGK